MKPPKPLFVPLNGEYFQQFATGTKRFEWRQYYRGWNERTCVPGREAILANGYGWPRLLGVVRSFDILSHCPNPAFDIIFPGWIQSGGRVAQIGIDVIRPLEHGEQLPLPLFRE
jgi:hypothetical protein